jgi:hypothetical protein
MTKIDTETTGDGPILDVSLIGIRVDGAIRRRCKTHIATTFQKGELARRASDGALMRVIELSLDFDAARITWLVEDLETGESIKVDTFDLEKTSVLRELGDCAK